MRVALIVTGGVDESRRVRIIPSLLWLIERLAQRHEVHVYALRYLQHPASYPLLGATVHDLGRPKGIRRQYTGLTRALRRDGPFDLVHAYWGLPAGLVATLVAQRLGLPSVVTLDSGEFVAVPAINYGLQLRLRQRLAVSATCRLATRLTVCSRYQLNLARAHGASADLIPLGVDTRLFVPPEPEGSDRYQRPLRPLGPPWRLIHVASLNRVKDQPTLVEAMRQLLARVPDVHLDIVGEDTLGGAIQTLAMSAGIDRHVAFHGFQHSDAIVPLYQQAHLAILSSVHEAAGVVTLEAAACGVPTIGSDVGYVADWAPDAAIAVRPGDPAALAAAIERAVADPALLDRIATRARTWTLEHDADWTASEFCALYEKLVHGGN